MKRSPFPRRSPMRRQPGSTKYARRPRDLDRMAWIRSLPCAVPTGATSALWLGPAPDPCARAVQAHHAGERGIGQKAPDNTCLPLCDHHHDCLTDRSGVFGGWPRRGVKIWELDQIIHYQIAYDRHVAGSATTTY